MDKNALAQKIKTLDGLTNDEKSALLELLHERKKYGIVWEDKPEDVETLLKSEVPLLTEVKERAIISDDKNAPNHILIEGDNLHALTALSYTHAGKIDVIYIDPPYNTGNNDFIYNDSYVDKEDSYRHSKWLSFMSKRLEIAKQLLSEKGVVFISIDDNEQAQLKLLCDEIFYGFDYVATIPWRKRTAKSDVPHYLSQDHEYILCLAKNGYRAGISKESRKYYQTPDYPNRPWRVHDLTTHRTGEERPNSFFTIVNPKNGKKYPANPNATWRITKDTFDDYYSAGRIVFPGDYDFLKSKQPLFRYWKEDDERKAGDYFGFTTVSSQLPETVGMTQDGTKNLVNVMGNKDFGFIKPVSLIHYLLLISNPIDTNATVLDFFAGSGTTLHATMQLNAEDGGHRQCILVTNNENNICEEVTYERNKRVIQGYTKSNGEVVEGLHSNNLRYYKTVFVPRKNTMANMRALMSAATDLLCIKNNVYKDVGMFGGVKLPPKVARYFDDGRSRMLVIYAERFVKNFVKLLLNMEVDGKILVYVFSNSGYAYNDDFEEVLNKVELCAVPDAIYKAYKKVLPSEKAIQDAESTDKAANVEEEDAK